MRKSRQSSTVVSAWKRDPDQHREPPLERCRPVQEPVDEPLSDTEVAPERAREVVPVEAASVGEGEVRQVRGAVPTPHHDEPQPHRLADHDDGEQELLSRERHGQGRRRWPYGLVRDTSRSARHGAHAIPHADSRCDLTRRRPSPALTRARGRVRSKRLRSRLRCGRYGQPHGERGAPRRHSDPAGEGRLDARVPRAPLHRGAVPARCLVTSLLARALASDNPAVTRLVSSAGRLRDRLDHPQLRDARRILRTSADVVLMGESVLNFVGPDDADTRTLARMVADGLPGLTTLAVHGGGYHAELLTRVRAAAGDPAVAAEGGGGAAVAARPPAALDRAPPLRARGGDAAAARTGAVDAAVARPRVAQARDLRRLRALLHAAVRIAPG